MECGEKVIGVGAIGIFDAEIVNDKTEGDVACVVCPKARCVFAGTVSMWREMSDELVVRENAGLGKSIHAAVDFDEDETLMDEIPEVILVDDGLWNGRNCNPHVLFSRHWCAEVEVLEIECSKSATPGGNDAVE